jgi:hypothetical protein
MNHSFKRWVAVFVLLFSVSQFAAPRSEAIVGLVFKNRIIKTMGGLGAMGGGTLAAVAYTGAIVSTDIGTIISLSLFTAWGIALGGLGIVLLEDQETVADIEFKSLNLNQPNQYIGFSRDDAMIYNQELSMLNAIRQTIASQVSPDGNTQDAEELWKKYSTSLSPQTFAIAQFKARVFLESLAR